MENHVKNGFQKYAEQMKTRPYTMNAMNAAIIGFSGDIICQKVIEKQEKIDWKRTARFTFFCAYYQGVIDTGVYRFYSRLGTSPLKTSLIDNFIHVPFAYMPAFLLTDGFLQGKSVKQITEEKREDYVKITIACIIGWVPFQWLNFRFVPVEFQVVAVNFAALVWNVVLDSLNCEE